MLQKFKNVLPTIRKPPIPHFHFSHKQEKNDEPIPQVIYDIAKKKFLIRFTKSLHVCGTPVHRTEFLISQIALSLEVSLSLSVLPNLIIMSFGDEDLDPSRSDTRIFRLSQVRKLFFLLDFKNT